MILATLIRICMRIDVAHAVYDFASQSIIISDYSSHSIVRWVLGAINRTATTGNSQQSFGNNLMPLRSPVGIKLDPVENIYVADG